MVEMVRQVEQKSEEKYDSLKSQMADDLGRKVRALEAKASSTDLQKGVEMQIKQLEQSFKNQFFRRIELTEEAVDTLGERLD
jgi:molecular chaperone GrpE (heat shock protein)